MTDHHHDHHLGEDHDGDGISERSVVLRFAWNTPSLSDDLAEVVPKVICVRGDNGYYALASVETEEGREHLGRVVLNYLIQERGIPSD